MYLGEYYTGEHNKNNMNTVLEISAD